MARGWESKSVDEQQLMNAGSNESADPGAEGRNRTEIAERERRRQELELQRERILSERTASPVRRAALQAALKEIESRLDLLV
jgi:hypothetical protein